MFSLCLPSSNSNNNKKKKEEELGVLLIGGSLQDRAFLLTTPLIVNPVITAPKNVIPQGDVSFEYFIDVRSIEVGGKVVNFNTSLLSIDDEGIGGTKISSTIDAFTVLHSSIYKPLVGDFVKKAAAKKIKRVASVAPFGACFDSSTIGSSGVESVDVPTIDLAVQGKVKWTIHGTNSMVSVNKNVTHHRFVDGGEKLRTSIVIGAHQLEDSLLEFDLVSSKLSFSSSLLLQNLRCSNFRS